MVGTHPELEEQATRWLPGQNSPDHIDALTQDYEQCMQLVGAVAQIAVPSPTTPSASDQPGTNADFWDTSIEQFAPNIH